MKYSICFQAYSFRRVNLFRVCALAVVLMCAHRSAESCSCGWILIPEHVRGSQKIFIGSVVTALAPDTSDIYHPARWKLSVERAFKGNVEREIIVKSGSGGGDCGYPFTIGKRYLVFTDGEGNSTTICTHTQELSGFSYDLYYLEHLHNNSKSNFVFGRIQESVWNGSVIGARSNPGIIVSLSANGQVFEATTDSNGIYVFSGLQAGKYVSSIALPSHLTFALWYWDTVTITKENPHVQQDFWLVANGRISGRVVDGDGDPLDNVEINIMPTDSIRRRHVPYDFTDRTDKNGAFCFRGVLPGEYFLGVNLYQEPRGDNPFPVQYIPGVKSESQASRIQLAKGDSIGGFQMTLQERLPTYSIEGAVVFENGEPLGGGSVMVGDSVQEDFSTRGFGFAFQMLDSTGHFRLNLLAGQEGWLHVNAYPRLEKYRNRSYSLTPPDPIKISAFNSGKQLQRVMKIKFHN